MTVEEWLRAATDDAERRKLPDVKPLLETFARSLAALRQADFNDGPDDDHDRRADC